MRIEIPIKPLSVNEAHHGRHIKTKEFIRYENEVAFLLPFNKGHVLEGEYFIKYVFYIKNYKMSDTGNFEKLITDILVKRGYLKDDRYVKAMYLEKESVKDIHAEKIVLDIVLYADRYKLFITPPLPSLEEIQKRIIEAGECSGQCCLHRGGEAK